MQSTYEQVEDTGRSRRGFIRLLCAGAVFFLVLLVPALRLYQYKEAYGISTLEGEKVELLRAKRALQLEIGVLKSHVRLTRIATHTLGMVEPVIKDITVLR